VLSSGLSHSTRPKFVSLNLLKIRRVLDPYEPFRWKRILPCTLPVAKPYSCTSQTLSDCSSHLADKTNASSSSPTTGGNSGVNLSPRRMAAAQKARWAKVKGTPSAARPKRRISAAGIARIGAAAKAHWVRVRAEKEK
jgi:hypothetical protein